MQPSRHEAAAFQCHTCRAPSTRPVTALLFMHSEMNIRQPSTSEAEVVLEARLAMRPCPEHQPLHCSFPELHSAPLPHWLFAPTCAAVASTSRSPSRALMTFRCSGSSSPQPPTDATAGRGLISGLLPRTTAPGPPPAPPAAAEAAAAAAGKAKVPLALFRGVPRSVSRAPVADVAAVGRVLLGVRLRWAVTSSRDLVTHTRSTHSTVSRGWSW